MSSSSSQHQQQQQQQQRLMQGPRPAPLRVHKDSHTIRRKPPLPHPQLRQPVIIYTLSPKVVHADPAEFMAVVQQLTGAASSSSLQPQRPSSSQLQSASSLPHLPFPFQLQPAATAGPPHDHLSQGHPAGILSPVTGSLQPAVPPGFFSSSPPGAGGINLFGELISPAFHGYNAALPQGSTTVVDAADHGAAPNNPTHHLHYLSAAAAAAAAAASPSLHYNWDHLFNNHPNL